MTPRDFIRNATIIQADQDNKSLLAIPEYLKAIQACKEEDDYELLYAHYQVMWINSHHDPQQAVLYAEKCLDLLKPVIQSGSFWHFTEMGQFHQEVIRYATNCIGWNRFSLTNDIEELKELLELVNMGCRYADTPEYFYILDTKVRIQLKLGQREEAFSIVHSCLKKHRSFSDFNDIIGDKEYQQWKANLESGVILQLSKEEGDLLEKAKRITSELKQRIGNDQINKRRLKEQLPPKEIISIGEAKERYKISSYQKREDSILVLKGDVFVKGPVDTAWLSGQVAGMTWNNRLYGVIIDGNLTVEGDVTDDDSLELFVTRHLACDYMFSCNGVIEIKGNATVKYGIYGEYNDGSLSIYGKVTTPYLISYDHSMPDEAEGEFIFIDGGNGTDRESLAIKNNGQYYEDSQKLLSPQVWDDADEFSIDKFFEIVKKGENPFMVLI